MHIKRREFGLLSISWHSCLWECNIQIGMSFFTKNLCLHCMNRKFLTSGLKVSKKLGCLSENASIVLFNFRNLANKFIKGEGLNKREGVVV